MALTLTAPPDSLAGAAEADTDAEAVTTPVGCTMEDEAESKSVGNMRKSDRAIETCLATPRTGRGRGCTGRRCTRGC